MSRGDDSVRGHAEGDQSVLRSLHDAAALTAGFAADPAVARFIADVSTLLARCFGAPGGVSAGKVIVCGNGGSCCDAMHFAEELTGRFRADRPPLPAIALADPGHLTCTANDFGFEEVFARPVRALLSPSDVLVVLSTSGDSENIVRAVAAARDASAALSDERSGPGAPGPRIVALLGKTGGRLRGVCDLELIAPGATADRIQELHMLALHAIVEQTERELGYA